MFALIDGNTFYASCERVFNPLLRDRPVVVLSNNDGCVVTRTAEAKRLGIKRGTPAFELKDIFREHDVAVFSSNYELYDSMSRRMMSAIHSLVPAIEVYSIDECFADVNGLRDLTPLGHQIRNRVLQWTGIPTCVGFGPTKMLAKLANHLAKTYAGLQGVLNWEELSEVRQKKAMSLTGVGEVWGIGSRVEARLATMGIKTVLDFYDANPVMIREHFGVVGERVQREIQGILCIPFVEKAPPRLRVGRSRSFGKATNRREDIISSVSVHIAEAARVLRKEGLKARTLEVCFFTSPFREEGMSHFVNATKRLALPTQDTCYLTREAVRLVNEHFKAGPLYKKSGVLLGDLVGIHDPIPEARETPNLFSACPQAMPTLADEPKEYPKLMRVMDELNRRYGRGTVCLASSVMSEDWKMQRGNLSQCFTTHWDGLLIAH